MKRTPPLRILGHISIAAMVLVASVFIGTPSHVGAQQTINVNAADLIPKTELSFSPSSGTFAQGSTFDVPLYLDTKGSTIGALELHISFDPTVLSVVKPSGGSSVIGLWIEAPTYDNTAGTITFIGGIPKGIKTSSGLVALITFQAKGTGRSDLRIRNTSRVLLLDGSGSPADFEANTPRYTVSARPPGSVVVSSETHSFHDRWYNNNNPVFSWAQDTGTTGYSTTLDDKPNTVPDNTPDTTGTSQSFESIPDGISYFHVKALKNGMWSAPTHYEVKIDTAPPAQFEPTINYITAAVINRALVTYFTTDALSGIDHYEVGTIDKAKPATESPAFVRSDSPYQIPFDSIQNARVIVRAFDRAGNVQDASIDVSLPFLPVKFVKDHAVLLLILLLIAIVLLGILHYFYGHHIARHIKTIWNIVTNKKKLERLERTPEKRSAPHSGRKDK